MRQIALVGSVLLVLLCQQAAAGQKSVTYYLDGARVEQDAAALNGYLEFQLPDSFVPGSLRVKPLGGATVQRVELVAADRDRRGARQIARLEERRGELQLRLQSLAGREEIFTAAAKAQSGKGVRKSKSNPDPMGSLQQGTEFALAQLDAVYRSRRKVQSALESVERELEAAGKNPARARIWLLGASARVSYLINDARWIPCYDFRWSGSDEPGALLLHARLPHPEKGVQYLVSSGTAAQGVAARPVRGAFPTLSSFPLTLRSGSRSDATPMTFAFDRVEGGLPPGEAAAFWRGEYLGSGRFPGGGASEVTVGQ